MVLLKATYTGGDQALTVSSLNGFPPPAPITWVILTPGANDLTSQFQAFAPAFEATKFNCTAVAYQSNHVIFHCLRTGQDSFGWVGAYDLGNKLPLGAGGTGKVRSFLSVWNQPASRWCTVHTAEYLGDVPIASFALQFPHGTQNGNSDYLVTLQSPVGPATAGSLSTIDVSTVWNTAWGPQPAGFAQGEPISQYGDHYLMTAQPGDLFSIQGGEFVRLVQKIFSEPVGGGARHRARPELFQPAAGERWSAIAGLVQCVGLWAPGDGRRPIPPLYVVGVCG